MILSLRKDMFPIGVRIRLIYIYVSKGHRFRGVGFWALHPNLK